VVHEEKVAFLFISLKLNSIVSLFNLLLLDRTFLQILAAIVRLVVEDGLSFNQVARSEFFPLAFTSLGLKGQINEIEIGLNVLSHKIFIIYFCSENKSVPTFYIALIVFQFLCKSFVC
jgi:hypothetical protein